MKRYLPILVLLAVSFFVHFLYFGRPREVVFDEVHFGKFISAYFTHEYYFDIHPPLGKLLISGLGYIGDFKPGFSFGEIGKGFPDQSYLWLRFLPSLAGALLPIVIFFLAGRLGFSRLAAFAAGLLVALDGALLTQSRFILLDSFLLLFGFLALLLYFKFRQEGRGIYLWLAGVSAALSVSIKWTGLTFLALICFLELVRLIQARQKSSGRVFLRAGLALGVVPILIYFSVFWVHFSLLNRPGPGDAFMTPTFRKNNVVVKFLELNKVMYTSNASLMAPHQYSSKWYTWPFMTRPVNYWQEGESRRIYLFGNPVIWWTTTVFMLYAVYNVVLNFATTRGQRYKLESVPIFLIGAYLMNLLPFIFISRAMFLYHYLAALLFAILFVCYLLDRVRRKKYVFTALVALSLAGFLFFSPLWYGTPLSKEGYNSRVWLSSWK